MEEKQNEKKLVLSLITAVILGSSVTVYAAPQYMADGAVFDPEWYLEQNPDVAVWPLGTSADALYQHYKLCGAQEGRKPYDESKLDMANILPYQGRGAATPQQPTDTTQPVVPAASSQLPTILMRDGKQLTDEKTIMAVEGESYPLAWNTAIKGSSHTKDLVNVMFRCVPRDNMDSLAKELLASHILPGYEWRQVQAIFAFDPEVRDIVISPKLYVDGSSNWNDEWMTFPTFDSTMDTNHEYPALHQEAGFVVNHNGVDYSGCAFCTTGNIVGDYGKTTKQFFILVPEGYSGGMSIILNGYREKIRFDF